MDHNSLDNSLDRIRRDLRKFIDLSLAESDDSWKQWLSLVNKDVKVRCWERKECGQTQCPAYGSSCSRCWLIAGTMCGGAPQGKFAIKYGNCVKCDVYQEAVLSDPINEVYEHLLTLVHSLRLHQQELKALAMHDLLTGLHNRNYLDMFMTKELKKMKRYGGRLMIYMMDINNFKHLNDTYGHLHGDGVLKEFSQILKRSIRDTDELIRFGGDEFLIVRHDDTTDQEDDAMINRIMDNIAAWNDQYGSEGYSLSFSYGKASLDNNSTLAEAIGKADKLMYLQKQQTKKPV